MTPIYNPGLHYLATLHSTQIEKLSDASQFKALIDQLITTYELTCVGSVWHSFEGGGFTAAIALTESHLSIHTWPEFGHATFDVFLSNYQQRNDEKVNAISQAITSYFEATLSHVHEIKR